MMMMMMMTMMMTMMMPVGFVWVCLKNWVVVVVVAVQEPRYCRCYHH